MLEKQFTGSDIRVRHSSLLGTIREEEEFTDSIKESVERRFGGDSDEPSLPGLLATF